MERTIEASTKLSVSIHRVREVLVVDPACLAGQPPVPGDVFASPGELRTTLSVEGGAGPGLHQEVALELGPVVASADRLSLAVAWEATAWHRLFPTFEGELEARPDGPGTALRLHGTYQVPLGPLGRFGDGVLGHRLARQSLRAFLDQAARRLEAEAARLPCPEPFWPSLAPVAVPRLAPSETFIG